MRRNRALKRKVFMLLMVSLMLLCLQSWQATVFAHEPSSSSSSGMRGLPAKPAIP